MFGRNILPEEDQAGREHEMILSYACGRAGSMPIGM
jgi:hypothetical protein